MKKWIEFIEEVIPDNNQREEFRRYVKNTITGIGNKKALCLYGSCSGKSLIIHVISEIIGRDFTHSTEMSLLCSSGLSGRLYRDSIDSKKMNICCDIFSKADLPIMAQRLIKKHSVIAEKIEDGVKYWMKNIPDFYCHANEMPKNMNNSISEIITLINMRRIDNHMIDPNLAKNFIADKEQIKNWFLK